MFVLQLGGNAAAKASDCSDPGKHGNDRGGLDLQGPLWIHLKHV